MAIQCVALLYLAAYAFSIIGGGFIAGPVVKHLRRQIERGRDPEPRVLSLDWLLGGIERTIVTTMVIFTPPLVPVFIGGWVALKFAANWQARMPDPNDKEDQQIVGRKRLTFLVGSAISISVAILAGLLVSRHAIDIWAASTQKQ